MKSSTLLGFLALVIAWWWAQPGLRPGDPEAAIVFSVWLAGGLTLAWLGSSVAYWTVRLRTGSAPRSARLSFPGSRRIAQGLLAATMTFTAACGASSDAPVLTYVGEAPTTSTTPTEAWPTPPSESATSAPIIPRPAVRAVPVEAEPPPTVETPSTHTVEPGEHLWSIAVDRAGADADLDQVTHYWLALVEANRENLTSSNPNLIFPGETLILPVSEPGPAPAGDAPPPNPPTGVS